MISIAYSDSECRMNLDACARAVERFIPHVNYAASADCRDKDYTPPYYKQGLSGRACCTGWVGLRAEVRRERGRAAPLERSHYCELEVVQSQIDGVR